MKAGRFSESQIVAILKQQDSGLTVTQISREHGVSEATFYNWNGAARAGQIRRYAGFRGEAVERFGGRKSAVEEDVSHRRTGRAEFAARNHEGGSPKKSDGPPLR